MTDAGEDLIGTLAANVKRLRQAKGWTQETLAERSGISTTGVQRLEAGERWPRPGTLVALARALSTHIYRLFTRDDEVKPSVLESLDTLGAAFGYSISARGESRASDMSAAPYYLGSSPQEAVSLSELYEALSSFGQDELRLVADVVAFLERHRRAR